MLIALLTAVTVVLGMMMMGALLISSLIIFPAITSMRVFKSFKGVVISSAIVSVLSFLIGFFISLLLDTAPGRKRRCCKCNNICVVLGVGVDTKP